MPLLVASPSTTVRPLGTLAILPVGQQRARWLPHLKLKLRRTGGETGPRFLPLPARAAHNPGGNRNVQPHVEPNHFVEERRHIWTHYLKIQYNTFHEGVLYCDAADMSAQVCASALKALVMASKVVDSASLTSCAPSEISKDTILVTLRTYVDVFVRIADDSYNKRLMKKTVVSFLDALRGLVCISHILLEAALEGLSHTHPRESLSEYAFNCDVKTMHREFNWQISGLQDDIRNTPTMKAACKMVLPTILNGVEITESILGLMVARRQRALEKASKVAS